MKKHLPLVVAVLLLTTGCSIYHPQAVDIPLINHDGDTRVDVSLAASTWILPDVMTVNATVSHGFNDWLAGQVHVNYGGENFYTQLAPGAYLPLGEHGLLEGYVGTGFGGAWRRPTSHASDTSCQRTHDYKGRASVPFGQVTIGWHALAAAPIDLALGLKAGAYLPDFTYREYDSEGNLLLDECYNYRTPSVLFEPQLVFRIGGERVKFCLRGSFAWLSDLYNGSSTETSNRFTADLFTLSAGVNLSF